MIFSDCMISFSHPIHPTPTGTVGIEQAKVPGTNGTVVKGVTHNRLYREQCCQHSILSLPGRVTVPFVPGTISWQNGAVSPCV